MRNNWLRLAALWAISPALFQLASPRAAAPPAEELLPSNTVAVLTAPNWSDTLSFLKAAPTGQLWDDPAMRPFREEFQSNLRERVLEPLERELDIQVNEYLGLAQGQVTLAVIARKDGQSPGLALIVDSVDRREDLTRLLESINKKWIESGQEARKTNLRGKEFSTISIQNDALRSLLTSVFPAGPEDSDAGAERERAAEITFGQSESLLVVGTSPDVIEPILTRQSGGALPALAEQARFRQTQARMFRGALGYGWIDFEPIFETVLEFANRPSSSNPGSPLPNLSLGKLLSALGFDGLKSAAATFAKEERGAAVELFLDAPETSRQGVFKIIAPEDKDASPPSFVPADAIKFTRWRIDGRKAWATVEETLNRISPDFARQIDLAMSFLGKDRDPNFDLKRALIGNLGDDFISFQMAPEASDPASRLMPPTLWLIGSPNPDQMALGLQAATGVIPSGASGKGLQEREFLGRTIYSFPFPAAPQTPGGAPGAERKLSFAASAGYLVIGMDESMLESYLRETDSVDRPLRNRQGLMQAAQTAGGMTTGFFSYENQKESARLALEALKNQEGGALPAALPLGSLSSFRANLSAGEDRESLADPSLLPSFDRISKYFSFIVTSGRADSRGLSWKIFSPEPPNAASQE